jgi:pimeloyl-ACP methyl ester carboxylesterase
MALGGRVTVGDVAIPYEVTGSPADPSLLLLHGPTDSLHTYDVVAPKLAADGYRVVAIDHREHGRSSGASTDPLREHAADAVAVIEELIGEAPVVIGHALGGMTGIYLAVHHPDHCRALVIEDPPTSVADDLASIRQPVHLLSGGPMLHLQEPDRYLAEVRSFLQGLPPRDDG